MLSIQKRQFTANNAPFNVFLWQLKGNFTVESLKKWIIECLTNPKDG